MRKSSWLKAVCLLGSFTATAHGQDAGAPTPAPPATAPAPAASTPTPPPASSAACVPACRTGFVCVNAQCVSACNPACPAGESCTADGQCLASRPPAAPAATSAPASSEAQRPAAKPNPRWTSSYTNTARRDEMYEPINPNDQIRTGNHYHDGFYLRFGVGIGWMYGEVSGDSLGGDVKTTGLTVPVELAIGGTPVAGIVIGVGTYGLHLPALNYDFSDGPDETAEYGSFTVIGPFVDFYVRPQYGVHIQASPTLVLLSPGQSDSAGELTGVGYGAMIGAGYEIWVGKQWGGGWLVRLQAAKVTLEDEDGNQLDYVALMPSVLFTVTLH